MGILKVSHLDIFYQSVLAVKDVSFEIDHGDYFCIVGSNGSGKSSLVKGILGLVPFNRGKVEFNISKGQIAYLPQISTIPSDLPATVHEIVITGRQKSAKRIPFYSRDDIKAAKEAMAILEITDISNKRIGELSGGQQQRVLLARALCRNPKLLILDEPCSGLDEDITKGLYRILSDLNNKYNITILMVSHDLDKVKEYANRVAVMDNYLKFCGNMEEWQFFRRGDIRK
ncbi:ABC transporter family protein [Clostridium argentinense CDC 2741]|uniref:ABC transporter family protein n=1 Tax=Clostridium argentinense CDC 2741 TaxID=1418104 RepID=A0A0C1UJQ5_9CLOT|nr:ABC transporter ATP-binding protein [Clostridium argentinense]ARC84693.1 hypothetical protein RSJ17_09200 [Clostridium argentinense]KIE47505.1 ABC transporter family protein [Clostridium argentinense CDC 2741]NFF40206.1 ABC transporter ATP-binding protein [Clostridium argentinense]NFP50592.1 ABC transporter ATP-binding protein [Clostridium argentinense]NFP72460.1 ABC transporter ATP-binding protein [Clostridium argentinense]